MKKYNVPNNDKKACLCKDGTYSTKCCEGELINQGIGQTEGNQTTANITRIVNGVITVTTR